MGSTAPRIQPLTPGLILSQYFSPPIDSSFVVAQNNLRLAMASWQQGRPPVSGSGGDATSRRNEPFFPGLP